MACEVKRHITTLAKNPESGYTKELNVIDWGSGDVFDLREWSPDHKHMSRGMTFTAGEMKSLVNAMVYLEYGLAIVDDELNVI